MITLSDIRKSYDEGRTFAVDGVSLEIVDGEFVTLVGESGCGKTTLMKSINRLIPLTSGSIDVDGEDILQSDPVLLRRRIGYVFQRIGLFPHMTVAENVATVPKLMKWREADIHRRVDELLEMVKLPPASFRDRLSRELSGGQQQRVGVARALAGRPSIMLMDEPFGALDPMTRDRLQEDYLKLHNKLKLTTVMVTHDMTEALLMSDRIAVMSAGKVLQFDTPQELMTHPRDDTVAAMIATPKRHADRLEALAGDGGSA